MYRPLAALRDTPKEVSKAVVEALFQINKTHEAAIAGKYSSWIPPLSYASLNFMQRSLGWIAPPPLAALSTGAAASTDFVALGQCTRSDNFYNAIVCTYSGVYINTYIYIFKGAINSPVFDPAT